MNIYKYNSPQTRSHEAYRSALIILSAKVQLIWQLASADGEAETGAAAEFLSREQRGVGIGPLVVWTVGELLCFETDSTTLPIYYAPFAHHSAVKEITGIQLDTRLGGEEVHNDTRCGAFKTGCGDGNVATGVEDIVMVKAGAVDQLGVRYLDVASYGFRRAEIQRGALHAFERTEGYRGVVYRCVAVGIDGKNVVEDISVRVATEVEIAVIGDIYNGRCIGNGTVADVQRIVVAQSIDHLYTHIAGETVVAVRTKELKG